MKNFDARLNKLEGKNGSTQIMMILIREHQTLKEALIQFNQQYNTNLKERTVKRWNNLPGFKMSIKISPNFDADIFLDCLMHKDKEKIIFKNFEMDFLN